MKIYIAQGMSGKTPQEIAKDRVEADYALHLSFPADKLTLAPKLEQRLDKQPVYSAARAVAQMEGSDLVAFCPDWDKYPNCHLERAAAELYGYQIVELEAGADGDMGCPLGQMAI